MYLIALLPPSNIRHSISLVQTAFFQTSGDPAALALPPHAPLAFFRDKPKKPRNLNAIQEVPFETSGYIEADNYLLLGVSPAHRLVELQGLFAGARANRPSLYPVGLGIPVARYPRCDGRPNAPTPSADPVLSWKTSHIICFELIHADTGGWWENLVFTEVWRIKLKRNIPGTSHYPHLSG